MGRPRAGLCRRWHGGFGQVWRNGGAWCNDLPIRVSQRDTLRQALVTLFTTLDRAEPARIEAYLSVALFEDFRIEWTGNFVFALGWLVLVLSIGAISLLNLLIRSGSAVNVASLFYLTPISTALVAFFIFGEKLTLTATFGMLLAVSGVYLVARPK